MGPETLHFQPAPRGCRWCWLEKCRWSGEAEEFITSRMSSSIDVLLVANAFMQAVDNATQKPACSCSSGPMGESGGAIPEKSGSGPLGITLRVLGIQGTSPVAPGPVHGSRLRAQLNQGWPSVLGWGTFSEPLPHGHCLPL